MSGPAQDRPGAVVLAEAGARAWRRVVAAQRAARPDHGEFYALAGELVDTLGALRALAGVLGDQIAGYGSGRVLYDDDGADPGARLSVAARDLAVMAVALSGVEVLAGDCWSEIGHIGVQDGPS